MSRQHFLAYYEAFTASKRDHAVCAAAFEDLVKNGTDVEITNALLLVQIQSLAMMNRKLRDIYGEDIGECASDELFD